MKIMIMVVEEGKHFPRKKMTMMTIMMKTETILTSSIQELIHPEHHDYLMKKVIAPLQCQSYFSGS